ncbi:uncharacterized [Tachysurus ichikawai]
MHHRYRTTARCQIRSRTLFVCVDFPPACVSVWGRANRALHCFSQLCCGNQAFSLAQVVRHEIGASRHTSITLMWCRQSSGRCGSPSAGVSRLLNSAR